MLIIVYLVTVNAILPKLGALAYELVEPAMVILITLTGIVMILGSVGLKVSNNLGSTVVNGIFRAIGYICRTLIRAIGWLIQRIVRVIPFIFFGSRQCFRSHGLNGIASNLLAIATVLMFLVIII